MKKYIGTKQIEAKSIDKDNHRENTPRRKAVNRKF